MGYLNNDNLYRKFGTDAGTAHSGGEYHFDGPHCLRSIN